MDSLEALQEALENGMNLKPPVEGAPNTENGEEQLTGLQFWSLFVESVNWKEPWILALVTFHITCTFLICVSRSRPNLQMVLFFTMAGLGFAAEYINEIAALNWQKFSEQQYFDHGGFFVAVMLCFPILINLVILTIIWLCTASEMLIAVKRAELKRKDKKKD
eukprot:m.83948 g.83948  ORF g.83948 m.83948 type:complete len:163 (-) comp12946_c0_seq5:1073-1561(-)